MNRQRHQSTVLIVASLVLLVALVGGSWDTAYGAGLVVQRALPNQPLFIIPTFEIVSVDVDNSVTIQTHNFLANDTYDVLMNYIGTRGVGGFLVTTINSGAGGTFTQTFNIPSQLKGQKQIAIRLQSSSTGYFAYNWFWNNSGGIPPTGSTPVTPPLPPGVIPTFSIISVVSDSTVSIKTANFPANDTFNVLMNYMGTRGVGGIQVDTINTNTGGTLAMTFNIPAALKGQRQIAIRLQSPTSGFFAYNWFWNNTTSSIPPTGGTPVPPPLPPGVIPTFSISGVVRDSTVTVQTANFPANDTFVVTMNYMGTHGVGGVQVDSFSSGTGGSFSRTFTIPDFLKGQQQIAIRIYSPTSGYFAYNWFWNNNAP